MASAAGSIERLKPAGGLWGIGRPIALERAVRVAWALVCFGVRAWLGGWWDRSRGVGKEARLRAAGERLTALCLRLGPSFVKIGQLVACRGDVLPAALLEPLRRLHDDVPGLSPEKTRAWCARLLGAAVESRYQVFDAVPMASGSVGQVHRARLNDEGSWVAVKIQRPGIERIMRADLRMLRAILRMLQVHRAFRDVPLVPMIDDIGQVMLGQLDFDRERAHNERFRARFAALEGVRFPSVHGPWSGPRILTMDLVEGARRIDDRSLDPAVFEEAAERLVDVVFRMIFVNGEIHCDLHPANVLVESDGTLIVLDTGFVTTLEPDVQTQFARFFLAIIVNDGPACAAILRATATGVRESFDEEAFERDVSALIAEVSGRPAGGFSVAGFAAALFELQRRHGLRGSPVFIMAIVALLVVEGVVRARLPELNFQAKAMPHLLRHIGAFQR